MIQRASFFILIQFLLMAQSLFAWPPKYGAEFSFTNDSIERSEGSRDRMRNKWADHMKKHCKKTKECKVTPLVDKNGKRTFRIEYKDGFWYQIAVDPAVIEVQTKPSTLVEYKKNALRMEHDIFEVAKSLKLEAHEIIGGGHINIGIVGAFDDNPELFADFIVDFMNHPEIAEGALDVGDIVNAPSLSDNGEEAMDNFNKVIKDFEKGKIKKEIAELSDAIEKRVYEKIELPPEARDFYLSMKKYQALNLTTINNKDIPALEKRLEIRSIRAQKSAQEFILQCELFENRMEYLKKLRESGKPIRFAFQSPITDAIEGVPLFYRYVVESGLKWEDYYPMMDEGWREYKFNPCKASLLKDTH